MAWGTRNMETDHDISVVSNLSVKINACSITDVTEAVQRKC